jgi:hypothetical protein
MIKFDCNRIFQKNKKMFGILIMNLCVMITCLRAASPDSIQVTQYIANKGRSNLTHTFGPKVHAKIEDMIQDFEKVAPDAIDRNMQQLQKELASNPNLSQRAQKKLASKYAKKTTKEIKAEMKSIDEEEKTGLSLPKRSILGPETGLSLPKRSILGPGAELTKTIIGVMGLAATIFLSGIVLMALVGFIYVVIRNFMRRATYGGYAPYPVTPYPVTPYPMY